MGFLSRSSKGNHYPRGNNGSGHYQKKGLFNKLFDVVASRSRSGGHYNYYGDPCHNTPMQNQPAANYNPVICTKCSSKIPAGSKFCLQCGEKVNDILFCTDCGEELTSNAKFCLKCGKKLNG